MKVNSLSRVLLFLTTWTVAYQDPWSMGFSRHEYWNGLPFTFPADLPDVGIEPGSPALQADVLLTEVPGKTLGVSHFLEEISNLSHPTVFMYFFALVTEEGFLVSPCYSLELSIQMAVSFLFSSAFHSSSIHSYF